MFRGLLAAVVGWTVVACGSSDSGTSTAAAEVTCSPGKTESCACVGAGDVGAQTCDADGHGWGECACPQQGGAGGGGGSESGAGGALTVGGSATEAEAGASGALGQAGSNDCVEAKPGFDSNATCNSKNLRTFYGKDCAMPNCSSAYRLSGSSDDLGAWCCS